MNKIVVFSFVLFFPFWAICQDMQLSQYYNAPLYLNPALAGSGDNSRVILNYRRQWPSIAATTPYVSTAFSLDHNIESINSGVGLLFTRDRQGVGKLTSTEVSGFYTYQVNINSRWTFIPGIQAGIVSRSLDYGSLTFGDQITDNGPTTNRTVDEIALGRPNKLYPDISAGGLIYSGVFWLGLSAHHLNKPNQSFIRDKLSLPIKTSIQTGLRLPLGTQWVKRGYKKMDTERSILPSLNFKNQGKFNQLDIGIQMIYEPLMLGLWYRGIPIKTFEGFASNESIIVLAGVHVDRVSFGYSYDVTLSNLAQGNSGGAHEISLIYEWKIPYPNKRKVRPLPCPKFYSKPVQKSIKDR